MTNKERLIQIANLYYSGQVTGITDREYDELENLVKQEDPTFNVKEHIVYAEGLVKCRHLYPFNWIRKTTHNVGDNLRSQVVSKNAIPVPKYDGSSIRAYYSDGKLTNILSRSDEYIGVNQTNKLRKKVINEVPSWVKYADYELLVSIDDFGENARQKANGLVNSKYLDDDVEKYAIAAPFYVSPDGNRSYRDRMTEFCKPIGGIPIIFDLDELRNFHIDRVTIDGKVYPIDGIVVYDDFESDCVDKIFKFYSLESKVTKVSHIEWNRSNFGYYIPKVILNPITLQGKYVKQVAGGSVDTIFNDKICKGAEVEVVMAGLTIPQISKVISVPEVQDYSIPTCWDCGCLTQYTSTGYVCKNQKCSYYVNQVMQPWGWNIYNKMEYAVVNQGGLASVDAYISYLRSNKDFLELTKTKFEDIIKSRKLGEIVINCLNISRAGNKLKSKIIGCIPAVPTIKEIENPFDWFLSDRAKNEIKIKLAIIKDLISKLNELLKTECNLEIIKEG